ncbi:hypothetical protein BD779DRAFT_65562 [Infundibulicybe gibba]|nr:hypothetical protein BD779DRAFT_65562 [Infundibulicybe gibba]
MEDTPRIPFLRWISAQPPPVEHLTLGRLHPADFQSTHALLRALGPQLKVLDIYFSPKSPPAQISTELPLSTNVQLHTLILHMPPRHESHPHDPADAPLSLLANAGPALRRAVFIFHAAFATFGWNTFSRVLDGPHSTQCSPDASRRLRPSWCRCSTRNRGAPSRRTHLSVWRTHLCPSASSVVCLLG